MDNLDVHGLAHITGGGLPENLPRILPDSTTAHINTSSWEWPPIFKWLQENGNVDTFEMYRTFNCGVGMVLCVSEKDAENAIKLLCDSGENAWLIGHITEQQGNEQNTPNVVLEGATT